MPQHHGHNVEKEASNIKRGLEWKRKPQVENRQKRIEPCRNGIYIFDEEKMGFTSRKFFSRRSFR
jgi:hypothetical protein